MKLHKRQSGVYELELKEGQRGLLCSNKAPIRCPSLDYKFSQDTINSLSELGSVFKKIHNRITSEGYVLKNGKITKNENG